MLDLHRLHLSEEMLFGLGGGVGFIYWYMKRMNAPFIGTRYGKVEEFSLNICARIGGKASFFTTASLNKGYEELKQHLGNGEPACIFVDMPYLPYLAIPETGHFGGHNIVVFGLDETTDRVYLADRCKKTVTTTIEILKKAWSSKFPPFPAKNKLLKVVYPPKITNLEKGIVESIRQCCKNMLHPPIITIGLIGIKKWADSVFDWQEQFKGQRLLGCLFNTFINIEIGGTGGSAFRTMFAQFLKEAGSIANRPTLNEAAEMFAGAGKKWNGIAQAALPDSWHSLKRMRELSVEKQRIFEEQESGALEKMQRINRELDGLMKETATVLQSTNPIPLLTDLRQKILECYEVEKKTFEALNTIVK